MSSDVFYAGYDTFRTRYYAREHPKWNPYGQVISYRAAYNPSMSRLFLGHPGRGDEADVQDHFSENVEQVMSDILTAMKIDIIFHTPITPGHLTQWY